MAANFQLCLRNHFVEFMESKKLYTDIRYNDQRPHTSSITIKPVAT